MPSYHVRYWFERDNKDSTGEIVTETVEAESPVEIAKKIATNMQLPTITISPSFGPAQDGGLVVINTARVRYVEILPNNSSRF